MRRRDGDDIECGNKLFGDPYPGVGKTCQCQAPGPGDEIERVKVRLRSTRNLVKQLCRLFKHLPIVVCVCWIMFIIIHVGLF